MPRTDFSREPCSIARALAIAQDSWSFLILREVLLAHNRRFEGLREALGISRNILTKRLEQLTESKVLARESYGQRSDRVEYIPTERAWALIPVLAALQQWGDTYAFRSGGPVELRTQSGRAVHVALLDDDGSCVDPSVVSAVPRTRNSGSR